MTKLATNTPRCKC